MEILEKQNKACWIQIGCVHSDQDMTKKHVIHQYTPAYYGAFTTPEVFLCKLTAKAELMTLKPPTNLKMLCITSSLCSTGLVLLL